jgi:hypothetical protein
MAARTCTGIEYTYVRNGHGVPEVVHYQAVGHLQAGHLRQQFVIKMGVIQPQHLTQGSARGQAHRGIHLIRAKALRSEKGFVFAPVARVEQLWVHLASQSAHLATRRVRIDDEQTAV